MTLAVVLASCASKRPEPPKPRTESAIRELLNDAQTRTALDAITDAPVKEALERQFRERAREAARTGRKLVVERALLAENISIGNGLSLARVFTLHHEYDGKTFATYLNASEHLGGKIRTSLYARVGALGERLAAIDLVELDRVLLNLSLYEEKDPPCCPSKVVQTLYGLRGLTLEPLQ